MDMNELLEGLECLKVSALTKLSLLSGNIHNVTIGPNKTLSPEREVPPIKEVITTEPKIKEKEHHKNRNDKGPPVTQVIKELEHEMQGKAQEAIFSRCSKFEEFSKSQKREQKNQWMLQQRMFIENLQQQEECIYQTAQQYHLEKPNHNEKLVKHYQELIQRKLFYEQELEKKKEKKRIVSQNLEKITQFQSDFYGLFQDVYTVINACPSIEELKSLVQNDLTLLKTLPDDFTNIIKSCKSYDVGEQEVMEAAKTVKKLASVKVNVQEAVNKINEKAKESSLLKQFMEPPINQPEQKVSGQPSTLQPPLNLKTLKNHKKYMEVRNFLVQHTSLFQELLTNDQLKQFRFDCKKAVNIPVNAISAVNAMHLKDKYTRLSDLLQGKTVFVDEKPLNASNHPQGIPFCKDLLAKRFVLQGDLMVSSRPDAAFCFSTIIVTLWNEIPDFGTLLLGYFYIYCPYLVPYYHPRLEGQSDEEYYGTLGYNVNDGVIERQDKFLKRITGILRLYFAIMIAKPKSGTVKNPFGINNGWTYLASILQLEPQLDITATIIHTFLETIGYQMEITYGKAFKKLVQIISNKYLPLLKTIDSGGPVSRLEVLLQDYSKNGRFEKPNGVLSSNFW